MTRVFFILQFLLICSAARGTELVVYAPASFTDVLKDINSAFEKEIKIPVHTSFGSSSLLALQIDNGHEPDIYISANESWAKHLQARNKIVDLKPIANNRLALAGFAARSSGSESLDAVIGSKRFAMGDPAHVPLGQYTQDLLEKRQVWPKLREQAVFAADARQVIFYLSRKEVEYAFVYATDLDPSRGIVPLHTFDGPDDLKVTYFAAKVKKRRNSSQHATRYYDFLTSAKAKDIFHKYRFAL